MTRRGFALAVVALLGIALTAALTWSIGRLAGQHIGLASAPLSVIHGLAPASPAPAERPQAESGHRPVHRREMTIHGSTSTAAAVALPTAAPSAPVAPVTQPPAAAPPTTVTVNQASSAPKRSPARGSSVGGDGRDGSGDSGGGSGSSGGPGSSGAPGGSGHSGSGRDD
jgi:uncharacterized membrane protein YgcG